MIVKIGNPDINDNVQTFLTSGVSTTDTTLPCKNTAGFSQNDYIVIGKLGEDKTELTQITAISSDTSLAVSAIKFDHGTDTPITYIKYNQVRFYRSTDGGSTYSLLTLVALQVDRLFTSYDDTSSNTTYYYKGCFYNSTTQTLSSYSPILPASGFPYYTLVSLQNRVIDLFPDPNEEFLDRNEINDWVNEEYRRLVSLASKIDQAIFLKDNVSSPLSLTANVATYDLPTDFKAMKKVEISFDGAYYHRAYPQKVGFGYPNMVYDPTSPLYVFISNQMEIRPTPNSSSGRYRLWYYYIPTSLSSSTDEVDLSLRPYIDALVYHALARAKQKDKKYDIAPYWDAQSKEVETIMTDELQGRSVTDYPRWVDVSDLTWVDTDDTWLFEM